MKNIIFSFALTGFLGSFHSINAQKVTIGPSVGINLIQTEDTDIGRNFQVGLNFGAEINYKFTEKWSLNTGLFFTQKKKHYSFIDTTTALNLGGLLGGILGGGGTTPNDLQADVFNTTNGVVTENFIEIPFFVSYQLKKINFFIGPSVGYLISATRNEITTSESTATDIGSLIPGGTGGLGGVTNLLGGANNTTSTRTSSSKEGLRDFDLSTAVGIGYGMDNLKFNLLYSFGVLDYRDNREGDFESLNFFRFSIVYLFPLKLKNKAKTQND